MLDIQVIRDNPGVVADKARQKGYPVNIDELLKLDQERTDLIKKIDGLREQRNKLAKRQSGQPPEPDQIKAGKQIKDHLSELEDKLTKIEQQFNAILSSVPNLPTDDVPVGASEADNVVVKSWGDKPKFDFEPKNHAQIGTAKGWIDKERAAKVAGSRFVYLKGDLVRLEFALWQFALSQLTDPKVIDKIIADNDLKVPTKPFVAVLPPAVAKQAIYEATGRLNKQEQTYKIEDEDLWLNASAEHTMAPMYFEEILNEADLPLRYVGYTTAFRREAGTYGKDLEGILRLHQFNKMEMESFSTPDESLAEHFFLVAVQEHLMQSLGLPYRLVNKCTAEIGFPNARGMDIEVWLPGQNLYRETHTADYISAFQAQSLKTRIRTSAGQIVTAHTNDATAYSERPLIAILENFQTKDGNVKVPAALVPFMQGQREI